MNTQHTQGPWTTRESATHVTVTNARGDAVFHDDKRIPGVMADARLIAAAPELGAAMTETQIELSRSCRFTLTTHKDVRIDVCLDYTEHSSDHWHGDRETSIPLDADKAREVVAFMYKAFPEIAPAQQSQQQQEKTHDKR